MADHQHNQNSPDTPHDPYAALRYRDYRLFLAGNVTASAGSQMMATAVGWELYARTHSAMALGLIGLVQVLPVILLVLPAGHIADRLDRRKTVMATQILSVIVGLALAIISFMRAPVPLVYGCILVAGIAQAFNGPARAAMLPQLVPLEIFNNAATWNSSGFQVASMVGPALGGTVIALAHMPAPAYLLSAGCAFIFFAFLAAINTPQQQHPAQAPTLENLAAGMRFVKGTKIILAAITMDMFAVLLGGAVTLLPIYARDILHVGATGFGFLRAAPAVGAILMSLFIAYTPPLRRAGRTLLWAVAGFGVATIVFGISKVFWLSLVMLALTGAFDTISVVVRHTLVQLRTPDYLRGRVSAVNFVFIGTSNELGGFESGAVAALLSPVASVVIGGVGTIVVVLAVAGIWPEIRRLGSLVDISDEPAPA